MYYEHTAISILSEFIEITNSYLIVKVKQHKPWAEQR